MACSSLINFFKSWERSLASLTSSRSSFCLASYLKRRSSFICRSLSFFSRAIFLNFSTLLFSLKSSYALKNGWSRKLITRWKLSFLSCFFFSLNCGIFTFLKLIKDFFKPIFIFFFFFALLLLIFIGFFIFFLPIVFLLFWIFLEFIFFLRIFFYFFFSWRIILLI